RTPGPQVAPTGSDASMSAQIAALAAGSYWLGQPTWRSHLATNSAFDCEDIDPLATGSGLGASSGPSRLYAGASTTRRLTLAGNRAAYPPARGPPCDQATSETCSTRRSARRWSTTPLRSFQSEPMVVIGPGYEAAQ